MRQVYLAGPDVFLPNAVAVGTAKKTLCAQAGLIGLFPLDNEVAGAGSVAAAAIYRGNMAMLRAADMILANVTPFRGPSLDPGTAFEIGVAAAWGKPILLYSADPRPFAARVAPDGIAVEDFGLIDNLMIACAAADPIVASEPKGGPWPPLAAMAAFTQALARAPR